MLNILNTNSEIIKSINAQVGVYSWIDTNKSYKFNKFHYDIISLGI